MAIKKTVILKGDIELVDAYIKIGKIHEENSQCEYSVYVSKSKAESDKKNYAEVIYGNSCNIAYDTVDFRKQCYTHLKTIPEFIGAEDILEDPQRL